MLLSSMYISYRQIPTIWKNICVFKITVTGNLVLLWLYLHQPVQLPPSLRKKWRKRPCQERSHVASLNLKRLVSGFINACCLLSALQSLSQEGGCLLSRFHFTRRCYFLGHVTCQNLPWQGLEKGLLCFFFLRGRCACTQATLLVLNLVGL